MFKLIKKIFMIYFLCITLAGLVMIFIDSKFSERETTRNGKTQITKHTIDPNLVMFTSAIGGFLGIYSGIWLFDHEKDNFYLNWGSLLTLIYNVILILSVYPKSKNK
ncbi:hypothetical protein baBA2_000417 [Borrelia anserina]|uniref:Uncharacterized protein n=2 Tax=Borrelia anserina TaxID=143 RepID=W5SP66_BORAN|nr:hypothetical protein [Borrelia anserina]AHH08403.1 Hypothetical protein BAN_0072500 [Borrelia anserina BA2]APR64885.1 hypothetical protein N187_02070 [Borrelia anserina Es]UPA06807.1 hypothetical protein baBA2_000417 [Borrelia anserina]